MRITKTLILIVLTLPINVRMANAEGLPNGSDQNSWTAKLLQEVTLNAGNQTFKLTPIEMKSWTEERSSLVLNSNYTSEIENPNYCDYKKSIACALTSSHKNSSHVQKEVFTEISNDAIKAYITSIAKQFNKDPENAKFKIEDGKVSAFSLNEKGRKLDEEKSFEILSDYTKNGDIKSSLSLAYQEISPEVSTESVDNMGINTLIGEGRSDFKGSPKNRIFNINVAIKKFDGLLIKPGEEFSFVKTLGEVDGEHGYLPELVIKGDKTEPEFGGGICQVSTTAFRAAIYSGLKITARRNHAYPVSYYNPQGMDSTIYIPKPDLMFVNNTPGYILIQVKIEGTELIFDFYGTDDGRKTNVIGPKILERKPDGSMKTTFTQQVLNRDGIKIQEDIFNSNYESPSKFPHPGDVITTKPADWSVKQWNAYKKAHNL